MIIRSSKPFFVLFLYLITSLASAQSPRVEAASQSDLSSYIKVKDGLDQWLINGTLYYSKYYNVQYHPYYSGELSLPGSVVLSGTSYEDLKINYDIYSQYLVLDYQDPAGSFNKIILHPEHTDAFHLDGDYFEKISLDEQGPLFYQVITVSGLSCYIHWEKSMEPTSDNFQYSDFFSAPKRSYFLNFSGKTYPFSNKRTFATLCSGVPKRKIRKYMWRNSIRFSNATAEQLKGLLKYISSSTPPISGN